MLRFHQQCDRRLAGDCCSVPSSRAAAPRRVWRCHRMNSHARSVARVTSLWPRCIGNHKAPGGRSHSKGSEKVELEEKHGARAIDSAMLARRALYALLRWRGESIPPTTIGLKVSFAAGRKQMQRFHVTTADIRGRATATAKVAVPPQPVAETVTPVAVDWTGKSATGFPQVRPTLTARRR